MTPTRLAVYPGSFDPIHNGHLDIIHRCRPRFDKVIVAVLSNEEKQAMFSVSERVAMIERETSSCPECRVESFSGLLVDFMKQVGATTIVRGLRAISDFEYEFQMALMNRRLDDDIDTVFLMPKDEYIYLSSRLAKEVFSFGGNLDGLVPSRVIDRMVERTGIPAAGDGRD